MTNTKNLQPRVYIGLSGGVDSSLAAALLIEQGYDVTGVYMKNWTADLPGMKCPWAEDLADAKRVAVQLNIPFKVFDFQKEYKQKVVDYMIREYETGRTPNPDVMCNQEVKFKLFLDAALADGADMIATGHYARVKNCHPEFISGSSLYKNQESRSKNNAKYIEDSEHPAKQVSRGFQNDNANLLRAKCETKDQTYFLYRITEEALQKTLFPLGDFVNKTEVRREAAKRGLATARKPDSQGICFVGSVGIRDFLSQFVETKPGPIVDQDTGKIIGQHDGAIFYTFGQRHGLSVGGGLPYYVVGKDMAKNEVYVSTNLNNHEFWRQELQLTDTHWINKAPKSTKTYQIRLRHRAPLVECQIQDNKVLLKNPERAIAPGQSAVIYDGEIVLGGGIVV